MSILGTIDASTFGNNVGVTNGDATVTKNAADSVDVGDILVLNSVNSVSYTHLTLPTSDLV